MIWNFKILKHFMDLLTRAPRCYCLSLGIAVAWSVGVLFAWEMGPAQLTAAMVVIICHHLCCVG